MNEGQALTGTDALAVSAMTDGVGRGYPNVIYGGNNGGLFGNDNGALWLLFGLMAFGGGFNNNRGYGVSEGELAASQAAQTSQIQMSQMLSNQQNALFEIANLFSSQNLSMMEQNNTNLVNAIQGFNAVNQNITNQTNQLGLLITNLQAKMDQCCCDIKTQMLQDRLSDTQARLVTAQNAIDNANQSQYILGQLGRFVAWAGTGSPAAAVAAA